MAQEQAFEPRHGDIFTLSMIGEGKHGFIFAISAERVLKATPLTDQGRKDIDAERKVYKVLGNVKRHSPHILHCFEVNNPYGLVLQRCERTLRQLLESLPEPELPREDDVRKWTLQAVEGLAVLHKLGVIHADVGCHNLLLDSQGVLVWKDFRGSSVQDSTALTVYEPHSRLCWKEMNKPTINSDIFALGSAIYEMSTKTVPYEGYLEFEIQDMYEQKQFPSVKHLGSLRKVINGCWKQDFRNASEILDEIDPDRHLCCSAKDLAEASELQNQIVSPLTSVIDRSSRISSRNLSRAGMSQPRKSSRNRAGSGMPQPRKSPRNRAGAGMSQPRKSSRNRAGSGMSQPRKSPRNRASDGGRMLRPRPVKGSLKTR